MSQDSGAPSEKKDLTGILELPQADPVPREGDATGPDPFALNEAPPIEQVDDFASLDQLGMMDHPEPPETSVVPAPEPESEPPLQALSESTETPWNPAAESLPTLTPEQPFAENLVEDVSAAPLSEMPPPATAPFEEISTPAYPILDDLKNYSESQRAAPFEPGIRNEFHLYLTGEFDPYCRDKLLLFVTENEIGMTSSELDLQIKSNRVLLPRISEFSGIKLIQDLRDSGVSFLLKKPVAEDDLNPPTEEALRIQYSEVAQPEVRKELPILPTGTYSPAEYQVMDSIQMVQYLRAEILEVEKSELFQDLLDRMTESLRRRAALKGANALTGVHHTITPLRLPSQYQVEMSASLLKRR